MNKDIFAHIDETVRFTVDLSAEGGTFDPVKYSIQFAIASELDRPTIKTFTWTPGEGDPDEAIEVDTETLTALISFIPTANAGFRANTHVYQIRKVHENGLLTFVIYEGKIFLGDSLFD